MQSFSYLIKEHLLSFERSELYFKDCCIKTILSSFLSFKNFSLAENNKIELRIEENYISKILYQVLKRLDINFSREKMTGSSNKTTHFYLIDSLLLIKYIKKFENIPRKKCCKINWLKVAFICNGYLGNPKKNYHLEFYSSSLQNIEKIKELLLKPDKFQFTDFRFGD